MSASAVLEGERKLARLKRRALSLGSAHAYDYGMQFLLPVVLARYLEETAFGEYRLMWLVLMTVMAIAPLSMPQGLYYFLPRSEPEAKRLYVHHVVLFLAVTGSIAAWLLSPWNPLVPASIQPLLAYGALVPTFVALWCTSHLLDLLPTVEERVRLQAGVTISLSTLRTVGLAAGAILTGDLHVLIWILVLLVALKFALLMAYIAHYHGLGGPWLKRTAFVAQVRHAAPFGGSSALYGLRSQADQWVAASLFSLSNYAAFSIAAVLGPLVNLFRQSVNNSFLPTMSRAHAENQVGGMLELNNQANVMVASLVYPVLAFAFVFAEELVTLVYTSAYVEAAPVMRIYIIGLVAFVVELIGIMMLLHQGPFAFKVNVGMIILSVSISALGALRFGLPGAAAGSVIAVYLDRLFTLRRISARTGIPLRRVQDWQALARLLLCAALAGALAHLVTMRHFELASDLLRVAVGGAALCGAYGALLALIGPPRKLTVPAGT